MQLRNVSQEDRSLASRPNAASYTPGDRLHIPNEWKDEEFTYYFAYVGHGEGSPEGFASVERMTDKGWDVDEHVTKKREKTRAEGDKRYFRPSAGTRSTNSPFKDSMYRIGDLLLMRKRKDLVDADREYYAQQGATRHTNAVAKGPMNNTGSQYTGGVTTKKGS